jgi:phage tail sheath protein FI
MGAWIRSIAVKGIHYVPATRDNSIVGAAGVEGDTFLNDNDRTDLANAGINVIQNLSGYGLVIRNFFGLSTTKEFQFMNGLLMREYIKASCVDSLRGSENTPNSINRIREDATAVYNFMFRLWSFGSTGNVPQGETFGQSFSSDNTPTKFEDHVDIRADLVNNSQSSIDAGNRNVDIYFTYPAPAGSIKIGVGILLRG